MIDPATAHTATQSVDGRLLAAAAIGAKAEALERAAVLVEAGAEILVLDIASWTRRLRDRNCCTPQGPVSRRRSDRRECRDGGGNQ
ncbi:IMP dehydrogenase [Rhizobium beringeri]